MACSSSSSSDGSSSTGGSGSASPLNGTWDVLISTVPEETKAVLVISPTSFELDGTNTYVAVDLSRNAPSIDGKVNNITDHITGTHAKASVDFGQLPFALGGQWNLSGSTRGHCAGSAAADALSLDCSDLTWPLSSVLSSNGRSSAQRSSKLSSIFGELGGKWDVYLPDGFCNVKFEGNEFYAECTHNLSSLATVTTDTITMTFNNGTASGTTNGKLEISAHRRW